MRTRGCKRTVCRPFARQARRAGGRCRVARVEQSPGQRSAGLPRVGDAMHQSYLLVPPPRGVGAPPRHLLCCRAALPRRGQARRRTPAERAPRGRPALPPIGAWPCRLCSTAASRRPTPTSPCSFSPVRLRDKTRGLRSSSTPPRLAPAGPTRSLSDEPPDGCISLASGEGLPPHDDRSGFRDYIAAGGPWIAMRRFR